MNQLAEFWKTNKGQERIEKWPAGNTYTNHWESPTHMLRLNGNSLRNNLIHAVQEILEAWSGQSLVYTSLYGIRVYKEGAILAPHVDRLPLVTSAIINVAQDVDEPWVLEVIGHDGKAHNVTMESGDMVLYESHSVLHGKQSNRSTGLIRPNSNLV
jgi:prolyl 4-hydroxylase